MKKVLTMIVVLFMVLSLSGIALAEETTVTTEGQTNVDVSYVAENSAGFTVTIPAVLETGKPKTVSASGQWGELQRLSVTTYPIVTLYFEGNTASDYAVVPVIFESINLKGDYYEKSSADSSVTVDPENSLSKVMKFGTWKGTLTFDISMVDDGGEARNVMSYVDMSSLKAAISAGMTGEFIISGGNEWGNEWGPEWVSDNIITFTSGSTLTITGGEFSGDIFYTNHADVIIEDGTFNSILWISDGSLTITGGTFNKGAGFFNVDSVDFGKSFTISGGTFIVNPEEEFKSNGVKIAEGYHVHDNGDGTWAVVPDDAS